MWASLSPWLAYLSIEGALARRCRAPCCGGASARAHAKAVDGQSLVASSLVVWSIVGPWRAGYGIGVPKMIRWHRERACSPAFIRTTVFVLARSRCWLGRPRICQCTLGRTPHQGVRSPPNDLESAGTRRNRRFSRCGLFCHNSLTPYRVSGPSNTKIENSKISPPPSAPHRASTATGPRGARGAPENGGGDADVGSVRIGDEYVAHVPLAHKTQPPGRAGLNTII